MTLLITVFVAIISTAWWYSHAPQSKMRVDLLCWMYWGASIMWLVDTINEYIEEGADVFTPKPLDMLNDTYLGLSVVALGGVIWIAYLVIRDPRQLRPPLNSPQRINSETPADSLDLVSAR